MKCSEFEAEVNDLMDRRLPLQLSAAASNHCLDCPECSSMVSGFKTLFSCMPVDKVSLPPAEFSQPKFPQPKKHFENSIRSNTSLFSRPARNATKAGLAASFLLGQATANASSTDQVTLPDATAANAPPSAPIPVAVPDSGVAGGKAALNVTWNLKAAFLTLVPCAAAVYIFGISVFSQFGDSQSLPTNAGSQSATQPMYANNTASPGNTELRSINWRKTAENLDAGWRGIAMHRAGACQMPGVQPYFYSVNGAVEAIRTNFVHPKESKAPPIDAIAPAE